MSSIILTREKTSNLFLRAGPGQTSDPDHVTLVIQRHPQVLHNNKKTIGLVLCCCSFATIQAHRRQLHIKATDYIRLD